MPVLSPGDGVSLLKSLPCLCVFVFSRTLKKKSVNEQVDVMERLPTDKQIDKARIHSRNERVSIDTNMQSSFCVSPKGKLEDDRCGRLVDSRVCQGKGAFDTRIGETGREAREGLNWTVLFVELLAGTCFSSEAVCTFAALQLATK
mmetsp:Transcript_13112/g.25750  ORF Transcript_13112/g.25750 Transcript_13112/m.25750 type:complete len:146 (+) Transcript_13112:1797-2234(+)